MVWVHPSDGVDPTSLSDAMSYVNDPSLKFRTLQSAIDNAQLYLTSQYGDGNTEQQAVVYAMPGTYGPSTHGPASGDSLPIAMRDRVHVHGLGTRRCVLRGESTDTSPVTNRTVTWPSVPNGGPSRSVEVLLSYEIATPDKRDVNNGILPWFDNSAPYLQHDDCPETFDGFTLVGGDVQALLTYGSGLGGGANYFPGARISNCLFDLRHLFPISAAEGIYRAGPYFGIMLQRYSTADTQFSANANVGYLDGRTLIAHNTFLFARWTGQASNGGWESESRSSTVGVIDFSVSSCLTSNSDRNATHRGVGNPCLVSNLFRTRPVTGNPTVKPFATLGIGQEDTQVLVNGNWIDSNSFDTARVGSTNGAFFSQPTQSFVVTATNANWVHWNCETSPVGALCNTGTSACSPSTLPQPIINIWNGSTGVDPAFVGEFVASVLAGSQGASSEYEDWRLLPGSPMEDQGAALSTDAPEGFITSVHAGDPNWTFPATVIEEAPLFLWDGEHWGNPRVAGGEPDIGFDERGLVVQAGNWANGSNSHNEPGFMHPTGDGTPTRWFILPKDAGGVVLTAANRHLRLYAAKEKPIGQDPGNGWVNPPGTLLVPPRAAGLPSGYRHKYIAFTNTASPDISLTNTQTPWQPLGPAALQPVLSFALVGLVDVECVGSICAHEYHDLQGVVIEVASSATELLRGNLQAEYR